MLFAGQVSVQFAAGQASAHLTAETSEVSA